MQVPERLALIGGSILLASTLIFTLKSQASQILPRISRASAKIYDHIGDAQKSSDFNDDFKQARANGETTGSWGSSHYYIDKDNNLHVGSGELSGKLYEILGADEYDRLKTINIDQATRLPADSSYLFATGQNVFNDHNSSIQAIHGLDQLNTSNVVDMQGMFNGDTELKSLDLSGWDTHNVQDISIMFNANEKLSDLDLSNWDTTNVTNMQGAFDDAQSLSDLDLSHWNTSNVTNMSWLFNQTSSLRNLDISNFDTSHVNNMDHIISGTNSISHLSLGQKTALWGYTGITIYSNWKQGDTNIDYTQLTNGQSHPGTWVEH